MEISADSGPIKKSTPTVSDLVFQELKEMMYAIELLYLR